MIIRTILLAAVLVTGCTDDDPAPSVAVMSTTPEMLSPADDRLDDVTIVVDYSDLDGDLGGGTAEIHDCRAANLLTVLSIPDIAPESIVKEKLPISGSLDLFVNDVGAETEAALPEECDELGVAEPTVDAVVFCVILVDAAGHRGPGDCTAAIVLTP